MEKINDGGPAFPLDVSNTCDSRACEGMTIRDYFAGQALTLFPLDRSDIEKLLAGLRPQYELVAKFCYAQADALIAARSGE